MKLNLPNEITPPPSFSDAGISIKRVRIIVHPGIQKTLGVEGSFGGGEGLSMASKKASG